MIITDDEAKFAIWPKKDKIVLIYDTIQFQMTINEQKTSL